MKKRLAALLLLPALAIAGFTYLPGGSGGEVGAAGRVVAVEGGAASVVRTTWTVAPAVVTNANVELTYTVVWTNGAETVTNTWAAPPAALPETTVSYATNRTVSVWNVSTNLVPAVASCSTNAIPTNALPVYVRPGDRIVGAGSVWIEQ